MVQLQTHKINHKRRSALLAALGSACVPFGNVTAGQTYSELSLSLYNLHTTESFDGIFWADGEFDADALQRINWLLRDHRTSKAIQIDPRLLSMLYLVHRKVGSPARPFSIISGYRSAETNRKLAQNNAAVAKNSYHIKGRAVDIRLPGTETSQLKEAALSLRVGGVGYYQQSNFTHLDTGPFRTWS